MNEPSNFCVFPCEHPEDESSTTDIVQARTVSQQGHFVRRQDQDGTKKGISNRNLLDPSYKIQNTFGALSNKTANTDLIHQGGWAEYDTHNL
jgi:alpha-glucosidase